MSPKKQKRKKIFAQKPDHYFFSVGKETILYSLKSKSDGFVSHCPVENRLSECYVMITENQHTCTLDGLRVEGSAILEKSVDIMILPELDFPQDTE